jgi:precorrin-2 methylase
MHLVLIGIGTGNPEHLTVQAIKALNGADLVLVPRKGAARDDLAALSAFFKAINRWLRILDLNFGARVLTQTVGCSRLPMRY